MAMRNFILSEWHEGGKNVFCSRVYDELSRTPYRVREISDKRFRTEKSARDYCKRVYGMTWETLDEKDEKRGQ